MFSEDREKVHWEGLRQYGQKQHRLPKLFSASVTSLNEYFQVI